MAKKPRPNPSPGGRSIGPIGRARKAWIDRVIATDLETLDAYGERLKGHGFCSPRRCPICYLLHTNWWGGAWHLHDDGKFYAKPQLMPDGTRYKPGREEIAALRDWDNNPVWKKYKKEKEPE